MYKYRKQNFPLLKLTTLCTHKHTHTNKGNNGKIALLIHLPTWKHKDTGERKNKLGYRPTGIRE